MFSQYFGNFLLNKKLVSTQELKDALEYQKSIRVKLGVLAINLGYMNSSQVQELHQQQMRVDKKFGEIAIELGYLTPQQLQNLLDTQKQGHLQLSQALVDKSYLTLEQLEDELENYKQDCHLTSEELEIIKQGNIDKIVQLFLDFKNHLAQKLYNDYVALLLKNIIRLLDITPRLEKTLSLDDYHTDILVCQSIAGEHTLHTALACEEKAFLTIGSKFANEQFNTINELAQASVAEFLNVHNGIFLVNMSNKDIELQMKPHQIYLQTHLKKKDHTYIIPIHLIDCSFSLIISDSEII